MNGNEWAHYNAWPRVEEPVEGDISKWINVKTFVQAGTAVLTYGVSTYKKQVQNDAPVDGESHLKWVPSEKPIFDEASGINRRLRLSAVWDGGV